MYDDHTNPCANMCPALYLMREPATAAGKMPNPLAAAVRCHQLTELHIDLSTFGGLRP